MGRRLLNWVLGPASGSPSVMPPDEPLVAGTTPAKPRAFATRFAAVGFLVVGGAVFLLGFGRAFPPPPPPGEALCGNEALGGLCLMVIGAPLAGAVSSFVAWVIGATLDGRRLDRGRTE